MDAGLERREILQVSSPEVSHSDQSGRPSVRTLADQAFSRAAGAPLIGGNRVELLKDARENYPAWLAAISSAKHYIHFESYIIHQDDAGHEFAEALIAKSQQGVAVRLIYDWMGGFGSTSRLFWNRLGAAGIEVRCYNPPRLDSPFGWVLRDHRKMLGVDGQVGFISGLCVGQAWVGNPKKNIAPWRDTGIELRGPAVAAVEKAFAQIWSKLGKPLPDREVISQSGLAREGDVSLRVVATLPETAGMFRVDQLIAALARKRLWLTDAYYAGMTPYVQGLRAAASDGVDVRLMLPRATDLPIVQQFSRSGYRPLLEAGVRVFEWNGSMLHAKTAVADGHWARVGSSNLNIASWLGNCELDAIIEDRPFAQKVEAMYLSDLENATEIVLDDRHKVRAPGEPRHSHGATSSGGGGSVSRAAAGAIRVGNTVGAAFSNRRVMASEEARSISLFGLLLLGLAVSFWFFPRALMYPVVVLLAWMAFALLYKACRLYWRQRRERRVQG